MKYWIICSQYQPKEVCKLYLWCVWNRADYRDWLIWILGC